MEDMEGELPCANEAVYGDLCEECIDNRIDCLSKSIEQANEKVRKMYAELYDLINRKPLPVKICCKCKLITFCIRHNKKGNTLEAYCSEHLPRDIWKNQKNVDSLTEEKFRVMAGWPPIENKEK